MFDHVTIRHSTTRRLAGHMTKMKHNKRKRNDSCMIQSKNPLQINHSSSLLGIFLSVLLIRFHQILPPFFLNVSQSGEKERFNDHKYSLKIRKKKALRPALDPKGLVYHNTLKRSEKREQLLGRVPRISFLRYVWPPCAGHTYEIWDPFSFSKSHLSPVFSDAAAGWMDALPCVPQFITIISLKNKLVFHLIGNLVQMINDSSDLVKDFLFILIDDLN